jgi:hypothetical protein
MTQTSNRGVGQRRVRDNVGDALQLRAPVGVLGLLLLLALVACSAGAGAATPVATATGAGATPTPPEATASPAELAAAQTCKGVATDSYGPDAKVAGAFRTTVGEIRSLVPMTGSTGPLGTTPSTEEATLCYVDGAVPKAPPPGGGEPFDRAVLAVVAGRAELIMAGYRDQVPVRVP